MDRRLFVTGLFGVVGTAGFASVLPRQVQALAAVPLGGAAPQSDSIHPKLPESGELSGEVDEGFELAHYTGYRHRHRHRHRVRRWRRVCRRWWHIGHWHRKCRRRPHFIWLWFWI